MDDRCRYDGYEQENERDEQKDSERGRGSQHDAADAICEGDEESGSTLGLCENEGKVAPGRI